MFGKTPPEAMVTVSSFKQGRQSVKDSHKFICSWWSPLYLIRLHFLDLSTSPQTKRLVSAPELGYYISVTKKTIKLNQEGENIALYSMATLGSLECKTREILLILNKSQKETSLLHILNCVNGNGGEKLQIRTCILRWTPKSLKVRVSIKFENSM